MLREQKPDFVDIATTVASHRPLVELAASTKVPAIVQKPFGPTLADCEAMVAACADGRRAADGARELPLPAAAAQHRAS